MKDERLLTEYGKWLDEIHNILIDRTMAGIDRHPYYWYMELYDMGLSPFWAACIVRRYALGIGNVDCQRLRRELGIDSSSGAPAA